MEGISRAVLGGRQTRVGGGGWGLGSWWEDRPGPKPRGVFGAGLGGLRADGVRSVVQDSSCGFWVGWKAVWRGPVFWWNRTRMLGTSLGRQDEWLWAEGLAPLLWSGGSHCFQTWWTRSEQSYLPIYVRGQQWPSPLGYQLCGWEVMCTLSCLELNYFKCTVGVCFQKEPWSNSICRVVNILAGLLHPFFFFFPRIAYFAGILVPRPGIKPGFPAVEARSPNHLPPGNSLAHLLMSLCGWVFWNVGFL